MSNLKKRLIPHWDRNGMGCWYFQPLPDPPTKKLNTPLRISVEDYQRWLEAKEAYEKACVEFSQFVRMAVLLHQQPPKVPHSLAFWNIP